MKGQSMKITVSAAWMAQCGYAAQDTVMEVTRVHPQRLPDGTRMFDVIRPDGSPWTVAEWRCKAIDAEGAK